LVLVEDKRSKRVAIVAHCLLNQNAKVNGFAFFPAMIKPLIDILHKNNFGVIQLPCPETTFSGTRRWWYVREQYDTPGYRSHCRRTLEPILSQIVEYQKEGYKVVIIGLDGSPSCGVRWSGTSKTWGGPPKIPEEEMINYPLTRKPGVFIEELIAMIKETATGKLRMIGAGFDMPGFKLERIADEIDGFLRKS
jgi:predicted secreted protein